MTLSDFLERSMSMLALEPVEASIQSLEPFVALMLSTKSVKVSVPRPPLLTLPPLIRVIS